MITITDADNDNIYPLDCDPSITLADVKALLEADSSIPAARQALYFNATLMTEAEKTLEAYGVKDGDLLALRDSGRQQQQQPVASGSRQPTARGAGDRMMPSESEMAEQLRQQVLSDPHLMTQIRHSNPQLADAARASPQEFLRLFSDFRRQMSNAHAERERAELELAAADEFDIDAQRRIEEAIQQERIAESLEHAMEYTPEVFGSVTMLYVRTEVNGTEVKAFVDSGAQSTIMSPECAERCGIMRLLDKRFAGMAVGVGTAKILGRVHSAMIKLSPTQFLPCTFTIMEGKGVDCLFGLDMLKRYQACIDLRKGALVINGEELPFLAEHELPQSEREKELAQGEGGDKEMTEAGAAAGGGAAAASANKPPAAGGQTLGATPQARPGVEAPPPAAAAASATAAPGAMGPPSAPASASRGGASPPRPQEQSQQQQQQGGRTFPPASIKALTDLGASEAQAKALLEASGGNVEVAAGLLFHGQ